MNADCPENVVARTSNADVDPTAQLERSACIMPGAQVCPCEQRRSTLPADRTSSFESTLVLLSRAGRGEVLRWTFQRYRPGSFDWHRLSHLIAVSRLLLFLGSFTSMSQRDASARMRLQVRLGRVPLGE